MEQQQINIKIEQKRKQNWGKAEVLHLLELVMASYEVINGAFSAIITSSKKKTVWTTIARDLQARCQDFEM